jgi:hypothetical protein
MARRPVSDAATPNPHAESIDATELENLISSFYGTRTLLIDKAIAETLLEHNTGIGR